MAGDSDSSRGDGGGDGGSDGDSSGGGSVAVAMVV